MARREIPPVARHGADDVRSIDAEMVQQRKEPIGNLESWLCHVTPPGGRTRGRHCRRAIEDVMA